MKTWKEMKQEMLTNPEVQAEYDALQPEFELVKALLEARKESNLTQQQLSDITGVDRADISKIENGNSNPTIKLLQRLAQGMNMDLKIQFVPKRM
jgi:DNA-binding XRE family transcriptional regulator